jgi:coenzyme F420 hydrogenase subunit beta
MAGTETTPRNVCEMTEAADLCIGCGLCAGICPPSALQMTTNARGEYVPVEVRDICRSRCNLCIRACPFGQHGVNEDQLAEPLFGQLPGIQHRTETGYVLKSWAGYSRMGHNRAKGASGGLTTWFLQTLLKNDVVDRVVTVSSTGEPGHLYEFAMFDNPADLQQASQSVYYPVEMSEVIKQILAGDPMRYAIVGLPCFLKAIRLAAQRYKRLRDRIVVLVGLTCGELKSKFFAEYLCASAGLDPARLEAVRFREKDTSLPTAKNYRVTFRTRTPDGDEQSAALPWSGLPAETWGKGYFTPNACNYCDDVFAEMADVVFMDAWLPRYIRDNSGTNFVIVRRPELAALFEQGQQLGEVVLGPAALDDVITSQAGSLAVKRDELAERLADAAAQAIVTPPKRVSPVQPTATHRRQIRLRQRINHASKAHWVVRRSDANVEGFTRDMHGLHITQKLINYPGVVLRRMRKVLSNG